MYYVESINIIEYNIIDVCKNTLSFDKLVLVPFLLSVQPGKKSIRQHSLPQNRSLPEMWL